MERVLKIGSRSSPLALKQAQMVQAALSQAYPALQSEIVAIKSEADWNKQDGERPLSEEKGGKGMFATEIEAALLDGRVDIGVHSMKDMATDLPEGLVLNHVLPRHNPQDVLIAAKATCITDLPQGAVIGTCSPRRAAIVKGLRPDCEIVPFRGNIETRLQKVAAGDVDASFLALAGLERLGVQSDLIHPLPIDEFLPACGQGVVAIESRSKDSAIHTLLDNIHCKQTYYCAIAEREVLSLIDGTCQTALSVLATLEGGKMTIIARHYEPDAQVQKMQACDSEAAALALGRAVGMKIKEKLP